MSNTAIRCIVSATARLTKKMLNDVRILGLVNTNNDKTLPTIPKTDTNIVKIPPTMRECESIILYFSLRLL